MDEARPDSPTTKGAPLPYIIGIVFIVLLNGALAGLRIRTPVKTAAYAIGAVFGGAVFFALIAAAIYGVARAIGKRKPASSAATVALWTMLALLILNFATFIAGAGNPREASAQTAFTAAERGGLQVSADSMSHVGLGFAFPNPGPTFVPNHEYERRMAAEFGGQFPPDLAGWAFRDTVRRQGISLQVAKLPGLNEEKFRQFSNGLREGIEKSRVLSDVVVWEGGHRESRLALQRPNGLYWVTRCMPRMKPRDESVVCLQTYSDEETGLASVSNGLNVAR